MQTRHKPTNPFEEMLAKERSYVTTQTQLDLFVAPPDDAALPPPASPLPPSPIPVSPPPPAPPPEPVVVTAPRLVTKAATREADEAAEAPSAAASAPRRTDVIAEPVRPASSPLSMFVEAPAPDRLAWVSRPLIALAAVALAEALVIGWLIAHRPTPTLVDSGEIVVQSRPVASRVSIDGEDRGITPLTASLAVGPHIVEVRVGRSEPRVIPVEIRGGIQSSLYVELQSVATVGGIDVRTEPGRGRVTIDGRYRGDTPLVLKDLAPGDHEVLVEAGRQKIKQTVRVEPGITSQLVIPLR